jgi:hypothetical protein
MSKDPNLLSRRALLERSGRLLGAGAVCSAISASGGEAQQAVPKYLSAEATVPAYTLPDLLTRPDGTKISGYREWAEHRKVVLELFRTHVYGRSPRGPEHSERKVVQTDAKALDGTATLKRVLLGCGEDDRHHQFELTLFLPNSRRPAPVFLLLNNRPPENTDPTRKMKSGFWPVEEVLARGYGIAAIQVSEVAPDKPDRFRDGVIKLMEGDRTERPPDAWKAISAWAWGASRALDYMQLDPDVDGKHVAVLGHSRGGKAALWAGAQDERFALTISNDSGCTGAALSRRMVGESVKQINTGFPHWFCDNYRKYNDREAELPIDQHQLIALMAPRAVYVASAAEDLWADPKGEYLALAHASRVYHLYRQSGFLPDAMPGVEKPEISGPQAYHIRSGIHNLTPYDWQRYMDFADRLHWNA